MRHSKPNPPRSKRRARRAWPLALLALAALAFAAVGSAAPSGTSDLKIAKTASAGEVSVGSPLVYTIQVENLGPETATGVTVSDPLPKGLDYVAATTTLGQCSFKGQKVTCSLGTLETGPAAKVMSGTITLTVIPRESGTVVNTASVKGDQKDPVSSNDEASVATRVRGVVPKASCRGIAATVVGTPGNDDLVGTGGPDVIAALGGADTISSLAGGDLVCAGAGNDYVGAGSAADRVFGGAGKDRLVGRGGPDVLRGNAGNDVLNGNRGSDRLRGGSGTDTCRGGAGLDSVRGCER
jgi:uncharacterized repeat protein (TIGR01451 family)